MINILSSFARGANKDFNEVKRKKTEDNIQWLGRNLPTDPNQSVLVLVGGKSQIDFRLRLAQAHVRSDLLPSNWSHVMLVGRPAADLGSTKVIEISLEPLFGFGFPTTNNGVQEGSLGRYRSSASYPNIAVLAVPVPLKEINKALVKRFKMQRTVLDGLDLILRWLAYVWGVGNSANPLLDGFGVPSAAMLEIVIGAVGFDLTPSLESRSSCPEAIWQAAKYWHEYYQEQDKLPLTGAFYAPHFIYEPPKK